MWWVSIKRLAIHIFFIDDWYCKVKYFFVSSFFSLFFLFYVKDKSPSLIRKKNSHFLLWHKKIIFRSPVQINHYLESFEWNARVQHYDENIEARKIQIIKK